MTASRVAPRKAAPHKAALAKIHIAKKELGLDDETYRDLLQRVTGKRSSSGLNELKIGIVLDEFKRLGWKPKTIKRAQSPSTRKMHVLWDILYQEGKVRQPSNRALGGYVRRMTGVDNPEWLDAREQNHVIEALKQWIGREGLSHLLN